MTQKRTARDIYPLLILAGELLVVMGFFLITEGTVRRPVAWLNLAVCMLVLLIDTAGPLFFARSAAGFSAKIPSIGVLWFLDVFYTVASLGVMFAGWRWSIEFRVQLLAQLAVLFVVAGVVLTAMHATEHAGNVAVEERQLLASIDSLREAMKSLAMQISRLPALLALTESMSRCAEDVRYMTPSKSARALELESELLRKIRDTEAFLANQSFIRASDDDLRGGVAKLLEELSFLLQQRKACGLE